MQEQQAQVFDLTALSPLSKLLYVQRHVANVVLSRMGTR
jgi:hypothetical protein